MGIPREGEWVVSVKRTFKVVPVHAIISTNAYT